MLIQQVQLSLPDMLEVDGMFGLDKHTYYSDPELEDTDGDLLDDGTEMGQMYSVLRVDEDTVQINVTTILVSDVSTSEYSFLEDYIPQNPNEVRYIFDVYADPNDPDSDDDYYNDYFDQQPLTCSVYTYDINGCYNFDSPDDDYIKVNYNNSTYYGGYQGWYSNAVVNPDTSNLLCFIKDAGCGIVATNDVCLYFSGQRDTYSIDDYTDELLKAYESFPSYYYSPAITVSTQTIICSAPPSPSTVSYVLSSQYGYQNELYYADTMSYDELEQKIIDSLDSGKPIILCERDADWIIGNYIIKQYNKINGYNYDDEDYINPIGFPMYKQLAIKEDGSGFSIASNSNVMTNHYVTITGMVKDCQSGCCWLKIQSWGQVYYIDLVDFYNYRTQESDYSTAESTIIVFD